MTRFRRTIAATTLAAAAVMAGAGGASASDHSEHDAVVRQVLSAQCDDATTQFGAVNYNLGPVCIDFGSDDGRGEARGRAIQSDQDRKNAACNSDVSQFGAVNYNRGPVCIRF